MTQKVGDKAPNFKLHDSDSNLIELYSIKEKVILFFIPAPFSEVCTEEVCKIDANLYLYENYNIQTLSITTESMFANEEFKKKYNINHPILSDYSHKTIKDYDVVFNNFAFIDGYTVATRSVFVISEDKKIEWLWISNSPLDMPYFEQIRKVLSV